MYNLENKQKIIDLFSLIINIEERKQHNPGEIFALTEIKLYNKFSIIICKVYYIENINNLFTLKLIKNRGKQNFTQKFNSGLIRSDEFVKNFETHRLVSCIGWYCPDYEKVVSQLNKYIIKAI